MKMLQSFIRPLFTLLLVLGVTTAGVATSARPAQAGVVVSIGIGFGGGYGGYGPYRYGPYRPYFRRAGYYRRPFVRVIPAYYGRPFFAYPGRFGYGRPGFYGYARGYGYGYRYDRYGYGGRRFYR